MATSAPIKVMETLKRKTPHGCHVQGSQPSRDGIAGRLPGGQVDSEKCAAVAMESETRIPAFTELTRVTTRCHDVTM
ncbi:hypothetical protein KEM44_13395 (plasmid) [Sinorhizobium meliloti]|nr:hypothetical protein KEM44_13395 [Sinorhizobium meliloti]